MNPAKEKYKQYCKTRVPTQVCLQPTIIHNYWFLIPKIVSTTVDIIMTNDNHLICLTLLSQRIVTISLGSFSHICTTITTVLLLLLLTPGQREIEMAWQSTSILQTRYSPGYKHLKYERDTFNFSTYIKLKQEW